MVGVTVDQVIVQLEARVANYQRDVERAVTRFDRGMTRIEGAANRAERNTTAAFSRLGSRLGAIVGTLAGGLGAAAVTRFGDAWTEAGNKIAAASQISGIQAASLSELTDRAIESRTAFEPYLDLYARLLRTGGQVAATQEQVALATDIVAKSFKAGGASAQEQAAGIIQLGQALGSGFLQGDELRSLRENAPLIAQAIADEFKVSIGGLKKLGEEGKLTSDRVFAAILRGRDQIEAAFNTTNATIGDSFQNLRTALIRFVGDADDAVGATETLAAALNSLAKNLDLVAVAALALGARAIAPLVALLASRLAAAAGIAATALGLLAVQGGATVVALSAARTAIALLGGPIGAALAGLTALGAAFISFGGTTVSLEERINGINTALGEFETQATNLSRVERELKTDTERLETANKALNEAVKTGGEVAIATANADVAAIQRRIQANESLRDAILATLEAQKAALEADALLAQRDLESRFVPQEVRAPGGFARRALGQAGVDLSQAAIADRTADALERLNDEAVKANAAGKTTEAQREFLQLRANVLTAQDAVSQLGETLTRLREGTAIDTSNLVKPGGSGGGGSGKAPKLNEFEREIQSITKRSQALAQQISIQGALNPLLANYEAELEAAAVKADLFAAAQEAGVTITADLEQKITDLARAFGLVAVQADFTSQFASTASAIRQEIIAIEAQTDALARVNPLLHDYGFAMNAATVEAELLLLASQAGIEVNEDLANSIRLLAEEYAGATAAAAKLEEEQRRVQDANDRFASTASSSLKSFISDIIKGENALQSLSGILGKIGDQLLGLATDNLFSILGQQGGGFGFLGTLFTSFAAKGGIFAAGRELPRFQRGGVSGNAAIFAEAGPEAAVPLPDGRRIPVNLNIQGLLPKREPEIARRGDTINLGGIHVTGVKDARSFEETESQMMARISRKLSDVQNRRTA